MKRGLRNCNPGNIRLSGVRYKGEVRPSRDRKFRQFESMAWGYRAMFVLLDTYRVRHGLKNVAEMIARWAPPTENHTVRYIERVCKYTGLTPSSDVDTRCAYPMIPLVAAMSRVENGVAAVRRDVEKGWELYADFLPAMRKVPCTRRFVR